MAQKMNDGEQKYMVTKVEIDSDRRDIIVGDRNGEKIIVGVSDQFSVKMTVESNYRHAVYSFPVRLNELTELLATMPIISKQQVAFIAGLSR